MSLDNVSFLKAFQSISCHCVVELAMGAISGAEDRGQRKGPGKRESWPSKSRAPMLFKSRGTITSRSQALLSALNESPERFSWKSVLRIQLEMQPSAPSPLACRLLSSGCFYSQGDYAMAPQASEATSSCSNFLVTHRTNNWSLMLLSLPCWRRAPRKKKWI